MKIVALAAAILVVVGAGLGSCRLLAERPAPAEPVEPLPMAYAVEESTAVPTLEPTPTLVQTMAVPTPALEPTATPSPVPISTMIPPTPTWTSVRSAPLPAAVAEEKPVPVQLAVPEKTPSPVPVVPPRGIYPSPGIGSPEAMAMEEKTLGYLNWARARQGIHPYVMNPEMQELAREQALLYVQTRENTGQYPPADKISAATEGRGWFFREGGGPDPRLWLRWSYEEMEQGYTLRYMPFYRNPKGTDIGIAFAFYSGNGVFGSAGGSVVIYVWNGEWDR